MNKKVNKSRSPSIEFIVEKTIDSINQGKRETARRLEMKIAEVVSYGPKVVMETLKTRLTVEKAERAAFLLRHEGYAIRAYDFPQTIRVWHERDPDDILYAHLAMKELINKIAELYESVREKIDYKTVEGFKKILPYLNFDHISRIPINEWGTTLGGLLRKYEGSPSKLVLELINADPDFKEIRSLKSYDFISAPQNTWIYENGDATQDSRDLTKLLVVTIAEEQGLDYKNYQDFRKLLKHLNGNNFDNKVLNEWGTTARGMLQNAYQDDEKKAVLDLVENDPEFAQSKGKITEDMIGLKKHTGQPNVISCLSYGMTSYSHTPSFVISARVSRF